MNKLSWHLCFIWLIIFYSCEKKENNIEALTVETMDVALNDNSGVLFEGKILSGYTGYETNCGFVWDIENDPRRESGYYTTISEVNDEVFSEKVTSSLLKGQKYYMRAYVSNKNTIVYGNTVSFLSLCNSTFEILDYFPKEAAWGDTITIKHNNINFKKDNFSVFLGTKNCVNISSNDTIIKCLVPSDLYENQSLLSISFSGTNYFSNERFELLPMSINSFSPQNVTFRDTVFISGLNLNPSVYSNTVYLNNTEAKVVFCSKNLIKVLVPDLMINTTDYHSVKIEVDNFQCISDDELVLKSPIIKSISPTEVDRNDILTIQGENFNPKMELNTVHIGDIEATIISANLNEIKTNIPLGLTHGSKTIGVEVAEMTATFSDPLYIYEAWSRLNDFPGDGRANAFGFSFGNYAYAGGGFTEVYYSNKDCWKYNPIDDSWKEKANIEDSYRLGFTYDNEFYLIENSSLYRYNDDDDTKKFVSKCENIDGASFQFVFVHNEIAYLIDNNHQKADLWTYSFTNNIWSTEAKRLSINPHGGNGFVINNEAFYKSSDNQGNTSLYKFDFNSESFEQVLDLTNNDYLNNSYTVSVFVIGKYAYIMGGHNKYNSSPYSNMVRYNSEFNNFEDLPDLPIIKRTQATAFSINNIGYYGLGQISGDKQVDMWLFNPQKLKPK